MADAPAMVDFLMLDEPDWLEADWEKAVRQAGGPEAAASLLGEVRDAWSEETTTWTPEAIGAAVQSAGERRQLNLKKAHHQRPRRAG